MKSILLTIALMFTFVISNAQKNVFLTVSHKLASANFAFNQTAQNDLMQNFRITRIDYYISSIKIIHDGGIETAVPNKYIIAKGNATVISSLGNFNVTNVEGVKFSVGVEAPINNADPSLQPAGSPLSYQNPSMHWGWSSGYRFVALEGKAGNNFTTTFQMHGLGNANYFTQTKMAAGVPSGTNDIYINLNADYTQALKTINVAAGPIDHGTNASDLTVLQNFRDFVFSPSPTIPAGINDENESIDVEIYPNPTASKLFIDFDNQRTQPDKFVMVDVLGKVVLENNLSNRNEINVGMLAKGVYSLQFINQNKRVATKRIVIE
jgi:hypothetical protein